MAAHRINVNFATPGLFDTPGSRDRGTTQEWQKWVLWPRIGEPEDCAGLFLFLASDAPEYIAGQVISSNGGGMIL